MATPTKTRKWLSADDIIGSFDDQALQVHQALRDDPLAFCEHVVNPSFVPNPAQKIVLQSDLHRQRTMLAWARAFGKSFTVAHKIAHDLFRYKRFRVFLFSPAEDQSQLIFDKVLSIYQTSDHLSEHVPYKVKGSTLTVGGPRWDSKLELLKVGLDAATARGRHTSGKGYLCGDEINSHLYAAQVCDVLEPFILSGGGIIYLSSPGEAAPDNFMYQTYLDWKQQERLALAEKRTPKHRVIRCKLKDVTHVDRDEVREQLRKHKRNGTMWRFKREYLGAWVRSEGTYFAARDIDACTRYDLDEGDKKSTYCWSIDPAGRQSSFVVHIARYNQRCERMDIVTVLSYIFEDSYRKDSGDEKITEFEQIVDALCEVRKRYPPAKVFYDPNTERSLSERLENAFHFPMEAIRIGGYDSKRVFLEDLRRSLQDRNLAFNDPRIVEQLKNFAPKVKPTGEYEYPKKLTDHVICAAMIACYLGRKAIAPWSIRTGKRAIW